METHMTFLKVYVWNGSHVAACFNTMISTVDLCSATKCLVVAGIATPQLQPVRQFPTPRRPSAKGRASHKPVPHNQWYSSYNPLEQVQKGINELLKNVELSSAEAGTNNFCLQSSSLAHLFSRHLYSCSLSIYKFLYGTFNGGITTHGFGGGEALGDKDTTRVAAKTSTIGCMDSRRSSIDRAPWHGTYKAGGSLAPRILGHAKMLPGGCFPSGNGILRNWRG